MSKPFLFVLIALLAGGPGPITAADFEIAPPLPSGLMTPYPYETMEGWVLDGATIDLSIYRHIRMTGEIEKGDAAKLEPLLKEADIFGDTILSMDSPGGDFAESLKIGDMLAQRSVGTYVGPQDICLSACAFAFLGGRQMLIRNVLWGPWRFLHTDGVLGFHSPSLPGGVPATYLDGTTGEATFAQIAAPTRDNIRELQRRTTTWGISSDLLFEILGRAGANEFFFVDRVGDTHENGIVVVSDFLDPNYPAFGMVEAVQACRLVLGLAMSPDRRPVVEYGASHFESLPKAAFFQNSLEKIKSAPDSGQGLVFEVEEFRPGLGNSICTVERREDVVAVQTDRRFTDETQAFIASQVDGKILVTPLALIGFALPRSAVSADDLYVEEPESLFADVPEHLRARSSDYDFCADNSAGTWPEICRRPILHDGVAHLTAYVEAARQVHEPASRYYDLWSQEITRLCRPDETISQVPLADKMLGYCGLAVTVGLIRRLRLELLNAGVEVPTE